MTLWLSTDEAGGARRVGATCPDAAHAARKALPLLVHQKKQAIEAFFLGCLV